jgi:hypothetical protein
MFTVFVVFALLMHIVDPGADWDYNTDITHRYLYVRVELTLPICRTDPSVVPPGFRNRI